ncbi:MAG TPA: type I-U CRISPR-associated protein Csx17 [Streptosporangiaceae bacterium]|nr:type I-U CRISPR-associated protein Csx17 [Streptosporangiaceae bacterium]
MSVGPARSSTVTRHVLPGLRPEPLASYLAGLGLIRLLGEQSDPAATAAWGPAGLIIDTTVEDLAGWLADEYVPTPVLSPWNGGSGFGPKDVEPKRRMSELKSHSSPRLANFPAAIQAAAKVGADYRAKGWDKQRAVQEFRNQCPDALLPWIDASVVLAGNEAFFPPLLGTGGNDGRLDFSTIFHQRLLDLLDPAGKSRVRSLACARDLLAGQEAERLAVAPVGQFDPGAAGGPGSSRFGGAESLVNPWAYVLLVEGALLFAAGAARRHQHGGGRAAIPFTVYSSPDGSASGAAGEESRGEVWVPLWKEAFSLAEIRQLFGEARASWRGRPARRAVDFYAATRTLGVARGIDEFVRYGLQRRNGLAFTAVPVDRIDVRDRPEVQLVARIEDWVARARGSDASAAVSQAVRRFDADHLMYARDGGALPLARLLGALTKLEQAVGRSGRAKDKVPVRRPPAAGPFLAEFIREEDGTECPELRIAAGIASCATLRGTDAATVPDRTMRQILLPVDPPGPSGPPGGARSGGRWRDASLVAGYGIRPLAQVLADVLAWRSRTAADEPGSQDFRGAPTFRHGLAVRAADLHALALGQLDMAALDLWLRACLALDWRGVRHTWSVAKPDRLVPTLGLLHPLARGLAPARADGGAPKLALSPDWANRLAAGQARAVHGEAVARLRQCGWRAVPALPQPVPTASAARVLSADGVLLAAALVPRCSGFVPVMRRLTTSLRPEADGTGQPGRIGGADHPDAGDSPPLVGAVLNSPESPNQTQELS